MTVPVEQIRDTSLYAPLQGLAGLGETSGASLRTLAQVLLEWNSPGWCSLGSARASMELYKLVEVHWEGQGGHTHPAGGPEKPHPLGEPGDHAHPARGPGKLHPFGEPGDHTHPAGGPEKPHPLGEPGDHTHPAGGPGKPHPLGGSGER